MPRYDWKDLRTLAGRLLEVAGVAADRAEVFARVLVEADLMGHTTHGLRQLPRYLDELASGRMAVKGEPKVTRDTGGTFAWDGGYLPGPWLVHKALETAYGRIKQHPVVCGAVSRSHHIASLASYLLEPASRGLLCFLTTSDPAARTIAPFGGREPLFTPNPVAMAIPTGGDPILVDMSTSSTANGVVALYRSWGRPLPGPWLLDASGRPTDDPEALYTRPPGSVLPLGGMDLGYKGYALGLVVEALTAGLSGHGRADDVERWGASFFMAVMDPAAFGGADAFARQTSWLADACRASPPRPDTDRVRVPGDLELARRAAQMRAGLELDEAIVTALAPRAAAAGLPMPAPLPEAS
jgi:LDH2 family malate/lactate/ureidoglycolate dehydrogenase